ncbi:MAG: hypothetical protein ABJN26_10880 [Stappiaceae bacterium]
MYRDRFKAFGTAVTVSFCVLGLTACVSSSESTYGEDTAPDKKLMASVLGGVGLVDKKSAPINYKPRAPLAMPSSTTALPAPEAGTSDVANWPRDKDAELAAISREADRAYHNRVKDDSQPAVLNSRELAALPKLPSSGNSKKESTSSILNDEKRRTGAKLTPGEVAAINDRKATLASVEEQANQGCGERGNKLNKRCFLIEPPVEYNVTAESAPVPELVVPEEEKKKKDGDFLADPRNVKLN